MKVLIDPKGMIWLYIFMKFIVRVIYHFTCVHATAVYIKVFEWKSMMTVINAANICPHLWKYGGQLLIYYLLEDILMNNSSLTYS